MPWYHCAASPLWGCVAPFELVNDAIHNGFGQKATDLGYGEVDPEEHLVPHYLNGTRQQAIVLFPAHVSQYM